MKEDQRNLTDQQWKLRYNILSKGMDGAIDGLQGAIEGVDPAYLESWMEANKNLNGIKKIIPETVKSIDSVRRFDVMGYIAGMLAGAGGVVNSEYEYTKNERKSLENLEQKVDSDINNQKMEIEELLQQLEKLQK